MSTELQTDDTSVAVKILVGILVGPVLVLGIFALALIILLLAIALLVWFAGMAFDVAVVLPLVFLKGVFKAIVGNKNWSHE